MISVSDNDDVTSQAQQHSHGKQRLKRCVLRWLREAGSDCVSSLHNQLGRLLCMVYFIYILILLSWRKAN